MKNSLSATFTAVLILFCGMLSAQDTTLTISSNGFVGIGTTTPSVKLHVKTGINQHGFAHDDGVHNLLTWLGTSEGTEGAWIGPSTSHSLSLQTSNTARLTVDADGNVGIGTTTPGRLLQVGTNASSSVGVIRVGHNHGPSFREWDFGIGDATLFGHYDNFGFSDNSGGTIMILEATGQGGSVGINTLTPDQRLSVNGNASKVGGGSWATFSDIRMKQDINPFADGLSVIKNINPVTFRYNGKLGYPTDETYVGVIAQEIESIAPYTIGTFRTKLNPEDEEETDVLQFDGSALIYIAINAIQELDLKIEELKNLKDENQNLTQRLNELERMIKSLADEKNNSDSESMTALQKN